MNDEIPPARERFPFLAAIADENGDELAQDAFAALEEIDGLCHDLDRSMANHVADLNASGPVAPGSENGGDVQGAGGK